MSDVFISYSRKDRAFVDRLHQALEKRNLTVWVDLEGILPSAEWMVTIRGAIDEAEAVLFVISPDSIASEICGDELAHAVARNKRLIPVLRREPGAPVNEALARLNYVFARDTDDFEVSMDVVA